MSFHIKIGNYRFSKNLGNGSFGKVKSKSVPSPLVSGIQRRYWAQGGHQDHEQEEDQGLGRLREDQERNQSAPFVQPPAHSEAL